jgi:oxygen-dependent protoporphyrinogen oxidase
MPTFVAMERQHGSLILALQAAAEARAGRPPTPIFTSLVGGTQALIDRMKAELHPDSVRYSTTVTGLRPHGDQWIVSARSLSETFDAVIIALPPHVVRGLLQPVSPAIADLLEMETTSAVVAALAFDQTFPLPPGFGFLVPHGSNSPLLAATFMDQKWPGRTPPGGRLLRAFFGGQDAISIASEPDEAIAALALEQLQRILGPLPAPAFHVVRRWPRSLPQYAVGHLERMQQLDALVAPHSNLWLLGNAYRGVGLPDLIRDARSAVEALLAD